MKEPENSIYCCEFSAAGETFFTAGKDSKIRQYDTFSNKMIQEMSKDSPSTTIAHMSRVYSLIQTPALPSIMFSGGWDNKVIMWDTRTGNGTMSFGGPNICGDSLDVRDNYLLTGSWREKNPLELWDIRTGKTVKSAQWGKGDVCYIYSAKFSQRSDFIVAGGSESTSLKIFMQKDLTNRERLGYFAGTVNTVIVTPDGDLVFAGSQNGVCQAFNQITVE